MNTAPVYEVFSSVQGEATRVGERGVRVPLVVSDKDGRTSNLVLSIRLDPLSDEESG